MRAPGETFAPGCLYLPMSDGEHKADDLDSPVERTLLRGDRFFRDVLDNLFAFVGVLTPDGTLIEANRAALDVAGLSPEEVIGKPFEETYWWSYSEEAQARLSAAIELAAGGEASRYDAQARLGPDHFITVDFAMIPVVGLEGQVTYLIPSGVDITERKRIEEALRQSQATMAGMIGSAMDAIITIDSSQRIILFNSAAEAMFGCSASDAIGQPVDRFMPERFRGTHREHVEGFGRTKVSRRSMGSLGAVFGLRSDGKEFPIEASISQIENDGQRLYTVILRDIAARIETEERLREQAALLDQAQDAISVRDLEDRILFWNKGAQRLYGWTAEQAVGKSIRDLCYRSPAEGFDAAKATVLQTGDWTGEPRQVAKSGADLVTEAHWTLVRDEEGKPKSVLAINTDVTARKRIESQFLRAQRLESIGTLAGGIAHDLNNVLSPILMAVRMLRMKFADDDSQNLLATLQASAERGAALVSQVLSFARGIEGERIALQPKHLMKEVVKILKDTLPKSIEITLSTPVDLWAVAGDPTQLHQVLMNLCVNARDAMPLGGKLTIEAENALIDENYARMNIDSKPGPFVLVRVRDTGVGIPSENIDRIFEPFFTTKEHGRGTGLGLSTVVGIVKSHGGFVSVYSEPDSKTEFRVYIPAIEPALSTDLGELEADLPMGHGEIVLVVDDETAIREITKATLEGQGYSVLTASDGTEAIALYAQKKERIKAVIMDMMMPYLDGPATIRALQKLDPAVKIIASSGFIGSDRSAEIANANVRFFLQKPYTAEKLLRTVADILAAE